MTSPELTRSLGQPVIDEGQRREGPTAHRLSASSP